MPVTPEQKAEFVKHITSKNVKDVLEMALWWIRNNMEPDEVYAPLELARWAEACGYKQE